MKQDLASYSTRLQDPSEAEKYAHRFERPGRRRIDRREQRAVRGIFGQLSDCRSVLDVPCGAGRFLPTLARFCPEVLGADASAEVLEFARRRIAEAGLKARLFPANASQLPLAEGSVDAVFCNRLLHHILVPEERVGLLRELYRVARRCAVVSFFNYHRFGKLRYWLKRLKGRKPPYARQPTARQFAAEAVQSGFQLSAVVPVGPFWVAEEYWVLTKVALDSAAAAAPEPTLKKITPTNKPEGD